MIKVQDLGKSFDNRFVVRQLSFQAPDGTITGLLGSNGAGKTTTLRMICGVLKQDSGSILIDEIAGDPFARQRRVGALLDHMGIYSRLTVRENLAYFGRLRGMPPEFLKARVDQVLSVLGLQSVADRRTSGFSQGERMKTAPWPRNPAFTPECAPRRTNQRIGRPDGPLVARHAETLA
jgi:sodium transport system ATP-binding protein